SVSGFVGELAEVHLPGMSGQAQHENIRARTEDTVLEAGDDNAAHFRMLEADALDGVVQLDAHTKVIRIEFELVAWAYAAVFGDIHGKRCGLAFEGKIPVLVLRGICAKVYAGAGVVHDGLPVKGDEQ